MSEIVEVAERLDQLAHEKMDQLYLEDAETFDTTLLWDGLVALTYDLPRVINTLKER